MPTRTDEIPVWLENGQQVFIKTTLLGEELMDVAAIERCLSFSAVANNRGHCPRFDEHTRQGQTSEGEN